jgi:spermidine/putrescine transport system permease protein
VTGVAVDSAVSRRPLDEPGASLRDRRPRLRRRPSRESRTAFAQLSPILLVFVLGIAVPLGFFLIFSFWRLSNFEIVPQWNVDNYKKSIEDPSVRVLLRNTLVIAAITAAATTVIATATASVLRFRLARWQNHIMFLIVVALFSGYLVRIFAWETLLGTRGVINTVLQDVGLIGKPIDALLYTRFSAILVLTNFLVPIAVVPCYAAFQNIRESEIAAARDLGASGPQTYRRIVLPLAWPGVFAAFSMTFIIASGDYLTPSLVGGRTGAMIGKIVADTFLNQFDWPQGAALAILDLLAVLVCLGLARAISRRVIR